MENGKFLKKSYPGRMVDFVVAVLGGGAATNPTIPTNGTFTAAAATFPTSINSVSRVAADAPAHVSTGLYTVVYKHALVNAWPNGAVVLSAGASPTAALQAIVTKVVPATRTITVKVYGPTGTLTDLGTSDMLIIDVTGVDGNLS